MLSILAMQKKPVGESRIPTDYWAGFGFSKSMPEAAIREKFGNRYCGPTMSTTYEVIPSVKNRQISNKCFSSRYNIINQLCLLSRIIFSVEFFVAPWKKLYAAHYFKH